MTGRNSPTLRAYFAFMWGYPGKKLLFMGQEWAPWEEWSEARSLDWHLLQKPHDGMRRLVGDLNHLYRSRPALHARDCEGDGFEWLIVDEAAIRSSPGCANAGGEPSGRGHQQFHAGAAQRLSRAAAAPAAGARRSIAMPRSMAARDWAISARFMPATQR